LYAFLVSTIRAACPVHLFLLAWILQLNYPFRLSFRVLQSLTRSRVEAPTTNQWFPATGQIPQQVHHVPEVPTLFPERPIPDTFSDSRILEQLGQHIQQGIVNHYTGNFPIGPQTHGQFVGDLGGQFYSPVGGNSVTSALTSIAMHDDLKCVPRLLCEIAAGGRPGYTGSKQRDSLVPFVSTDTLLS
jgi:hypothetical protein